MTYTHFNSLRAVKKPKRERSGIKDGEGLIRSAKHLRYVRTLHCVDPLCERRDIVPMHVNMEDTPMSEKGGTGIKASDVMVVPGCNALHERMHREGHETVSREVLPPGVTLAEYAIKVIAPTSPDERVRQRAQELKGRV